MKTQTAIIALRIFLGRIAGKVNQLILPPMFHVKHCLRKT